jgi:TldD protein
MARLVIFAFIVCLLTAAPAASSAAPPPAQAPGASDDLLGALSQELDRSMTNLQRPGDAPLYYLQYSVAEKRSYDVGVENGGLTAPRASTWRFLDVDVRVGSMELDNTHEIRGRGWGDDFANRRFVQFPLDADPAGMRAALWNETEYQYRRAQERLSQVVANRQVKVEEQDLSNDFSPATPQEFTEPTVLTEFDAGVWQDTVKAIGEYFAGFDFVKTSGAAFSVNDQTTYMVNSEGARLKHENHYLRAILRVSGRAEDGMELDRSQVYSAARIENLPDKATMMNDAERIVSELKA